MPRGPPPPGLLALYGSPHMCRPSTPAVGPSLPAPPSATPCPHCYHHFSLCHTKGNSVLSRPPRASANASFGPRYCGVKLRFSRLCAKDLSKLSEASLPAPGFCYFVSLARPGLAVSGTMTNYGLNGDARVKSFGLAERTPGLAEASIRSCVLLSTAKRAGGAAEEDPCLCSTAICQIFQQGYFYLYPFNIEYSLFASTMLYVMWKNVGRLLASTHGHGHTPSRVSLFRETFFAGPVLGLLLFVVGLAVFILYEVQVSGERGHTRQALVIYYSFNIVCLGLMTLVSLSGSVIYRFDRRAMDHHKNPTRTLDVALLMGAALGQYAISYYSIVAVVVGSPRDLQGALNLSHALLMIAQHTFQNVFIIESLHRGPPGAEPREMPPKEPCQGITFANLDAIRTLPSCPPTPRLVIPNLESPQEAVAIISAPRCHWRRRCLKDISLFLLLCNVIVSSPVTWGGVWVGGHP